MAKSRKDFDFETASGAIDAYKQSIADRGTAYVDQYAGEKAAALGAVKNTPAFSYDAGTDPTYQTYKKEYQANARAARDESLARGTALTGGYANSYAQTAAQQAYNSKMSQLEAMIPQLRAQARSEYDADLAAKYNYLNTVLNLGESDFNRWLSQQNLSRQDAAELLALYQNNRDYEYQQGRDAVEDDRYREQFEYQKGRDAAADAQWDKTFEYNQGRDAAADAQWDKTFEYQQGRDAVADAQWEKEYDLDKYSTYNKKTSSNGSTPKNTSDEPAGLIGTYYKALGYDKGANFEKDLRKAMESGREAVLSFLSDKVNLNFGGSAEQKKQLILEIYAALYEDDEDVKPTGKEIKPNSSTYRYMMKK